MSVFNAINYRHLTWWVIFVVYVISSFYFSYAWLPDLPQRYEMKTASLVSSDAKLPNELNSHFRHAVNLPDWNSAESLGTTSLWYFISLKKNSGNSTKQAIYIPKSSQNTEVFLNGKWLGNGGDMEYPITRNRNNTLLFEFDSAILEEENILALHVAGQHKKRTYLGEIYIGPVKALRTHAELSNYLRIDISKTITLCMLLTSIIVSSLWVLRQSDSHYLYYGLFSALWAFHDSNHFIRHIPISTTLWETLIPLSFGMAMLGVALFIHRHVGNYVQRIENILILTLGILSLPFLYQDLDWVLFYAYHVWSPLISLIGIYCLYFLYTAYQKTAEDRLIMIVISGCSIMVFGMNDLFLATEAIPKQSPYMMHFAVLFTIITIIVILINRFVQSLNVMEHYNQELQHEIRRKTDDIEHSYQQVQQLMRKYTVAEERQRIMRDIHDGIGGQLVATLVSMEAGPVDQERLKSNLKAALQDLRMVIDSLDYEAEDLPTLLGMLRLRLSDQLSNASLKLHWRVDDLPRMDNFGPANVLNTMRIVQEAITNAIKHSNAENLTITTSEFNDKNNQKIARIDVADDGFGVSGDSNYKGRGFLNMQKRADLIGGKLTVFNDQGTVVRLELPVGKQPDTQSVSD